MSSTDSPAVAKRGGLGALLLHEWPYVLLYIIAVVGVAYTDADAPASSLYWKVLIPVTGAIAIIASWSSVAKEQRKIFLIKQILHWGAVLLVVLLLFLHVIDDFLNDEAHGFIVIYLLGLSAILAGIQWNWKIAVFGAFLIFSGIGFAVLADGILAISIVLALVILVGTFIWSRFLKKPKG